ncbi:MAG: MBL fold metallo-hydrolase [Proteobacteria bacterium]|nr:MBL fold metallo-hydrolase [Pseudomonadota bacterium]
MTLSISFLGGAGTVTGSKYLVGFKGKRVLVDCGLFQGPKPLRERNWAPLPIPVASINDVVLTHAHLDHSGYLPALIKQGYRRNVLCSQGTADLCAILLPDSGHLQEQDAESANRHNYSKHHPALPLYTEADAERAARRLSPIPFHQTESIAGGDMKLLLRRAGHILGAANVELEIAGKKLVFSGDIGRYGDPIMVDPETPPEADWVVIESTYGDRLHEHTDPADALGEVIRRTAKRGGVVVIPSFAVGRTQALLYHLRRLKDRRAIPDIPIYLDSPMAQDVTDLYRHSLYDHRLSELECRRAFNVARFTRTVEESKAISRDNDMPKVIVSASGMATGGRVLHHLRNYLPDRRNTVVLAGFQASGTRGASLANGAASVKMLGTWVDVRAEVVEMPMLSAHADSDELMRWLGGFGRPPEHVFITHGEPAASASLRDRITRDLGWSCSVPEPDSTSRLT